MRLPKNAISIDFISFILKIKKRYIPFKIGYIFPRGKKFLS